MLRVDLCWGYCCAHIFSASVFERAHRIIHNTLFQYQVYQANPTSNEKPDKAFLVVALDLLSGLVQGLGPESRQNLSTFVQHPQDGSLPLLLVCISVSSRRDS